MPLLQSGMPEFRKLGSIDPSIRELRGEMAVDEDTSEVTVAELLNLPVETIKQAMLASLAKVTREDPAKFTDDTVLADLGIDSVLMIEWLVETEGELDIEIPPQLMERIGTMGMSTSLTISDVFSALG